MNKYLELAQRILADSRSMMTARQIWDAAILRGLVTGQDFGKTPWTTLGMLLAREVKQHEHQSVFAASSGSPACYFLQSIEEIWGDIEHQADILERHVDPDTLLERILARNPKPASKIITVHVYERDQNVIAYVRLRAKHCCELCGEKGFPKKGGGLYIEVHHLKRLADGGDDTPENAAALCAGCHRRLHQSAERDELLSKLISQQRDPASIPGQHNEKMRPLPH